MIANPITGFFTLSGMTGMVGGTGVSGSSNEAVLTCYDDADANKHCFMKESKNGIDCKKDDCFITYTTVNQSMAGKRDDARDLGLTMLLFPNGLSTSITVIGSFKKADIKRVTNLVGKDLMPNEVDVIPAIHDGLPDPPQECHFLPVAKQCQPFLKSDNYTWIPFVGMKKSIDIMRDPKVAFKSEIKFTLPKFGKSRPSDAPATK